MYEKGRYLIPDYLVTLCFLRKLGSISTLDSSSSLLNPIHLNNDHILLLSKLRYLKYKQTYNQMGIEIKNPP